MSCASPREIVTGGGFEIGKGRFMRKTDIETSLRTSNLPC